MACDICGDKGSNCPLHCVTCARGAVELVRIELAKTLIERDEIGRYVEAVAEGSEDKSMQHVSLTDSKGGLLVDREEASKNVRLQGMKADTVEVQQRIQLIVDHAAMLREEMETKRKQFEVRKAQIAQRKSDLSSMTYGIESRRANEADKVQQNIKRMDYKSDKVHHETVEMRAYLCNTAARLAGVKMTRRRTKDGGIKEVYNIGPGSRLRVYDLRDLHDAPPDNLSASLGAVAQLLVRIASYLGVRLPAEITMPHADYPLPTIFRPSSSYLGLKVPFPATSRSYNNSPDSSRHLDLHVQLPKPRTLFIDRPLTHLAAQDAPAYSLFIEGVSLLAYNVAWICRTQGLKEDFKTWEDVCPIGRNLYRLLVTQETRTPSRPENPLDKDLNNKIKMSVRDAVAFGQLSHATSHSFLNTTENVLYLNGWKLTPTKINDDLRAYLFAEQQAQEWDVVDQKEWNDMEDAILDDPVLVGDRRRDGAGPDDGRNFLTNTTTGARTVIASDNGDGPLKSEERKKGTSGWTKLKSRNEE